jgi:hypothetical protein
MNNDLLFSTPHHSQKADDQITAEGSSHVADSTSAGTAANEIGTEPITSQNISSSSGNVDGAVARPELSADLHNQAGQGSPSRNLCASVSPVHTLDAKPLVTESPAIGERAIHNFEAGSNRPKPPKQEHPTPQQDAADLVLARIYPNGTVPPGHTGTIVYGNFTKEWDRDPRRVTMRRPSKSTVLRKLGKKKH